MIAIFAIAVLADADFMNGLFEWLGAGGAVALAATPVAGKTVTTKESDEAGYIRPEIDKKVMMIQPDRFPLDTVMREAGIIKRVGSIETKYYTNETRGLGDAVAENVAAVNGAPSNKMHNVKLENMSQWLKHDKLIVHGVKGGDGYDLVFLIVDIDRGTGVAKCIVLNGLGANKSDIPAIAAATRVGRIGHTKSQLDAMTESYAMLPNSDFNYCEIAMATVSESIVDKMHNKEIQWDIRDMADMALWDFRGQCEMSGLSSVRGRFYDPVANDTKYTQGGVIRQITKELQWSDSNLNNKTFQAWGKAAFDDNNGSESKILFASAGLLEALGSIPTVQKQLEARETEVVHGVRVKRIETNFGEWMVKRHKALEYIGLANGGVSLDMAFAEKHIFETLNTRKLDLESSGRERSDVTRILENSCYVLKNLDTHALIKKA